MNKIILTCVSLLFIGCIHSNTNQHHKVAIGTEGDGHTETFNNKTYCNLLKIPTAQYIKCTKNNTLQYASLGYMTLSKGTQNIEKTTIQLERGKEKLVLLLNIWEVSVPLSIEDTNKNTILHDSQNTNKEFETLITIDIKSIKNNTIIIRDNNNRILRILNIIN